MADVIYNEGKRKLLDGTINLTSDTVKVALMNNSHVANADTQHYWSDVSANEASGTGYTAGGATLGSKAFTTNDTNDRGEFDAADTVWATSTITAYYAIVYEDTGVAGTSTLIASIDFGGAKSSSGGDFKIEWNSVGILTLS